MLPDYFDNIQAVENILEEAYREREFATLNPADELEKGILENRVAQKGTCKQAISACFAVKECCTDIC